MRTKIASVLCACLAVAGLNCSAAPDSTGPQQSDSTKPQSDSDMLMNVASRRQPDGTYKKTITYVTRAQRNAEAKAKMEASRLRKQGLLAAPDIRWSECGTEESAHLYSQPQYNGNECCVIGAGSNSVANLCGFPTIRSIWSAWHGGHYGNPVETCGEWFEAGEYEWLWCDPSTDIQLDG